MEARILVLQPVMPHGRQNDVSTGKCSKAGIFRARSSYFATANSSACVRLLLWIDHNVYAVEARRDGGRVEGLQDRGVETRKPMWSFSIRLVVMTGALREIFGLSSLIRLSGASTSMHKPTPFSTLCTHTNIPCTQHTRHGGCQHRHLVHRTRTFESNQHR